MVNLILICLLHLAIINVLDCKAVAINAFSLNWSDYFAYTFCPFSILGTVLQKVLQDLGEAVIIAPFYTTQPWFPRLLSLGECTIFHSAASVSDTNSPRRQQTEESVEKDDPVCFSGLRECLKSVGIPKNTANIILSSWRSNTQKQCGMYLKKWSKFCDRSKID